MEVNAEIVTRHLPGLRPAPNRQAAAHHAKYSALRKTPRPSVERTCQKIGPVHGTKKRYLRQFSSTDEVEDRLGSGRWGALLGEVKEEAEGRGTRAEQSAPAA